jgi:hypothetical protein
MSYEEIALNEREVAQLAWKQQRDAAVDILRAAQQSSDLATRKNGYVADALAALGAEETK